LFHDIAKPRTKNGDGINSTFYNHDIVGAKMTEQILNRLKFDKETVQKITRLVRYHMFYYNVGEVTESSIRRLLVKVGVENIDDLICLRQADRIGSGTPKAEPYKLRHFKYLILKVSKDPISVKMLKINGDDLMQALQIKPCQRVGLILSALLADVLDSPENNTKEYLTKKAFLLNSLNDQELKDFQQRIEFEKRKTDDEDKQKFYV
jgi:poly(A) polymerase/tRNA nucleotidyltransferase (CCA-adding enzyme)